MVGCYTCTLNDHENLTIDHGETMEFHFLFSVGTLCIVVMSVGIRGVVIFFFFFFFFLYIPRGVLILFSQPAILWYGD